jgi:Ca2+-transporting ATPase
MTVRKVLAGTEMFRVSGAGYDPHGSFFRNGSAVEPSAPLLSLLRAAALASDARLLGGNENGPWHIKGDPTEGALVVAAAKARLPKAALDAQFPRIPRSFYLRKPA